MRICPSSLILLLAGGITFDKMPRAAAFFAHTPFFDHTHSTGFAKRSRAASAFSKGIHIRPNSSGGDDTQSPTTNNPSLPQHVEGEFPIASGTFSVIREEDNDGTSILRERINIEISEDDLAVLSELRGKISQQMNPYKDSSPLFGKADEQYEENFDFNSISRALHRPESVNVILFNPQTKEEGMHTIEFPKGSGNNIVLAFESRSECDRFAEQLAESGEESFSAPVTYEIPTDGLEAYCNKLGIFVQMVPAGRGTNIRPPTSTSPVLGHNPNLHIERQTLDYLFDMVEMTGKMDDVVDVVKNAGNGGRGAAVVHFDALESMYWVGDVSDLDEEDSCSTFTDDAIGCWE